MAIKSKYQKTQILMEQFLKDTGNEYRVVSQRPYTDRKGRLDDGVLLTLQITKDTGEYQNENEDDMIFQNFDVTVLCGKHHAGIKKGDMVSLHGFRDDVSYYIDFNYILRFDNVRKIEKPNERQHEKPVNKLPQLGA